MGYRSDVKVAIRKGSEMNTKFAEVNATHKYFTAKEVEYDGDDLVIYSAEWLKWYDTIPAVAEYMDVLNGDYPSTDCDYVVVGEAEGDIECNVPNGWLWAHTVIEDVSHT